MLGLVFTNWEKFLSERYGAPVLREYRTAMEVALGSTLLANRVYDDTALLEALRVTNRLTNTSPPLLLRQFGRYFINTGLTRHLCAHLLSQTTCARDLVLLMRQAHIQMATGPDGLTPPVFSFKFLTEDRNQLQLTYESPRHLCGWLWGAVEGAGDRFGETVFVYERACMDRGDQQCVFEIHFSPTTSARTATTPEEDARVKEQQQFTSFVLTILPEQEESSLTLFELQAKLHTFHAEPQQLRPKALLDTLQKLQYAGLLASTANHPSDDLGRRRYWRVPIVE
jgi:Haem-NO-binding